MSFQEKQIVCRRCNEIISTEDGNCPQCGASIRNELPYVIGIVLGVIIMGATLLDPSNLLIFGIGGLLLAAGSGYMIYEKRQRIEQASELT